MPRANRHSILGHSCSNINGSTLKYHLGLLLYVDNLCCGQAQTNVNLLVNNTCIYNPRNWY